MVMMTRQAEIAYDDNRLNDVLALADQGLATKPSDEEAAHDLSLLKALAEIRLGKESTPVAPTLLRKLDEEKLVANAAMARLALAEAWMLTRQNRKALQLVVEVLGFFESRGIFESAWRAHAYLAKVSENPRQSEEHRLKAGTALARLKEQWPAGSIDQYLQRSRIKTLVAGLQA
jgi:hypothetical protein